MKITFYKYHGTGNDFVMIDNRDGKVQLTTNQVTQLCNRRFGIGADGLILLQNHPIADFEMVYYNSDGNTSTMCGNGGRCIIRFAADMGMIKSTTEFMAIDGYHQGKIDGELVHLQMADTKRAEPSHGGWFLNTGSPHHICAVADTARVDVDTEGRKLRNSYGAEGANVNFIHWKNNSLHVRTYERGVEAETYSCGTGVTAAALFAHQNGWAQGHQVDVKTPGGELQVHFKPLNTGYTNIWLIGPATFVFKGEIDR